MSRCSSVSEQLDVESTNPSSSKNASDCSDCRPLNEPKGEEREDSCSTSYESGELGDLCFYDDFYENSEAAEPNNTNELYDSEELRQFREQRFRDVMQSRFKPSSDDLFKNLDGISIQDGGSDKDVICDDFDSSSERTNLSNDDRRFFFSSNSSIPRDPLDELHENSDRVIQGIIRHLCAWEQAVQDNKASNPTVTEAKVTEAAERVLRSKKTLHEIQAAANREAALIEEGLTKAEDDDMLNRALSAERLQEKIRDLMRMLENVSKACEEKWGTSLEKSRFQECER